MKYHHQWAHVAAQSSRVRRRRYEVVASHTRLLWMASSATWLSGVKVQTLVRRLRQSSQDILPHPPLLAKDLMLTAPLGSRRRSPTIGTSQQHQSPFGPGPSPLKVIQSDGDERVPTPQLVFKFSNGDNSGVNSLGGISLNYFRTEEVYLHCPILTAKQPNSSTGHRHWHPLSQCTIVPSRSSTMACC